MRNVAIIGYGNIAKKHIGAIDRIADFDVSDIIEPTATIDRANCTQYASLDDYLAQRNVADVAAICTPNALHAPQAIACLERGMDVLVEKPMAINRADAEKIIATSLEKQARVFCVMQLRYSPIVQWLKQIINSGELGDIYSVEVRCFWNRNKNYYRPDGATSHWRGTLAGDRGPLYTQFSHFVDLVYYLLGEWRVQHAVFNNFNHQGYTEFEDTGNILFNVGDTQGSFSYTTAVHEKNYESTITFVGSKGTISIGGQYFNQIRYTQPSSLPLIDEEALAAYASDRLAGHIAMYKNIINVLESKEKITTNALDGLKVVNMIENVYQLRAE